MKEYAMRRRHAANSDIDGLDRLSGARTRTYECCISIGFLSI